MPESKKRKPAKRRQPPRRDPNRAIPREPIFPPGADIPPPEPRKAPSRNPAREIPEGERYQLPELPEAATYEQMLVAASELDPLAQEVMIASRLAAMPHPHNPEEGMPIHIDRRVRAPWAHNLRKLGIFCFPELATHQLISPDGTGGHLNHTASTLRKLDTADLWEQAKAADPELARLVDSAQTPEQKEAAMKTLLARLPVKYQVAAQRLAQTPPEAMEPK